MNPRHASRVSESQVLVLAGLFVFGGLFAVGCDGSGYSGGTSAHPTTYDGTFTGSSGTSGTLSLTITPPGATTQSALMPLVVTTDSVIGGIHITGGGDTIVNGTFTTPSGPLSVSGGGYTFTGTRSNGVLSGTFAGPGVTSGAFTALVSTGSQPVSIFCGTFSGSDSGSWNLAMSGSNLSGSFTGGAGSSFLTGTRSGDHVSLTFVNGSATGTLEDYWSTVSGTWMTNGGSQSGTWTGSWSCD